jgi:hypothetical protein
LGNVSDRHSQCDKQLLPILQPASRSGGEKKLLASLKILLLALTVHYFGYQIIKAEYTMSFFNLLV